MLREKWLEKGRFDPEAIHIGIFLDISFYVKRFMEEKGMSKKDLASASGVSYSTIHKLLSGEPISMKTLAKVLSALKVDPRIEIKNNKE